jgi:hypothetical protein
VERCDRCNIPMTSAAIAAGECDLCAAAERKSGLVRPSWLRPRPSGLDVTVVEPPVTDEPVDGLYRQAPPARGTLRIRLWPERPHAVLSVLGAAALMAGGLALAFAVAGLGIGVTMTGAISLASSAVDRWRSRREVLATAHEIHVARTELSTRRLEVGELRSLREVDEGPAAVDRYRVVALGNDGSVVEVIASDRPEVARWIHRALCDFTGVSRGPAQQPPRRRRR